MIFNWFSNSYSNDNKNNNCGNIPWKVKGKRNQWIVVFTEVSLKFYWNYMERHTNNNVFTPLHQAFSRTSSWMGLLFNWLTVSNVPPKDFDVQISIISRLFVKKTYRMHQFMNHVTISMTTITQWQRLWTALTTNGRVTPVIKS